MGGGANTPPIFFLHKNAFWLLSERRSNKKQQHFQNDYFGVAEIKIKIPAFYGQQNRGTLDFAFPPQYYWPSYAYE